MESNWNNLQNPRGNGAKWRKDRDKTEPEGGLDSTTSVDQLGKATGMGIHRTCPTASERMNVLVAEIWTGTTLDDMGQAGGK
jgi:hypothetical protein